MDDFVLGKNPRGGPEAECSLCHTIFNYDSGDRVLVCPECGAREEL